MKDEEARKLPTGLYRVHWIEDGDVSLAAVGMTPDGGRWLAPTNWTAPMSNPYVWENVERVEPLFLTPDWLPEYIRFGWPERGLAMRPDGTVIKVNSPGSS